MPTSSFTIQDVLGPDGLMAGSLPGFEFRSSQLEMALLIQESLRTKSPAIVEAGTGTGKTFGYLVPVILSGKKAVISTGTKNLQDQIYLKDIPLLRRATGLTIDVMLMKGRKNYLCFNKYHHYFSQPSFLKAALKETRQRLEEWLKNTEFADRAELSWLADDDALWDALSSSSEQCLGAHCMFLDDCFLSKLRSRAAKSKIIIVNHHLFFADLKVKRGGFGEIIPRFQVVVFDEAHTLEDIASSYFGKSLSTTQLVDLVNEIENEVKDLRKIRKGALGKHLRALKTGVEQLKALFSDREDKGRLGPDAQLSISEGPAREISRGLRFIGEKADLREPDSFSSRGLVVRAEEFERLLGEMLAPRGHNWLNWYEKSKRGITLHASPLDVSGHMRELVYKKVNTFVLTSATISTNKTFDYTRSRLGLPEGTMEGIYPSHFAFEVQTLLYIPRDLPVPGERSFGSQVAQRIKDILDRTEGRALVLFTSYHNLNLVYEILKGKVPYTLYRQGDAPKSVLLEEFRQDIHSVLLATGSFWQGVDVPGEALSCLIIDKLPFDSPGEPIVAARIDAIRERGGNPFMEYQVPSAIITLKQGLGRLIRNTSDKGILAVLDIRIMTSRYGRFFLDSLPAIPISHDMSDISRFFEKEERRA